MKKKLILLTSACFLSSSLYSSDNEVNLQLIKYNDINTFKKVNNILNDVEKDGLTRDLKEEAKKWNETNVLLKKLVVEKNYTDAYILFKHINFDKNISSYKSYFYFFQIINRIHSKHSSFENIELIKSNLLLNNIFEYFFFELEKEKINDTSILQKINEALLKIDENIFSFTEKQRVRYKLELLRGKYVEALRIINTIEHLTQEDIKYKHNTEKILHFIQENFFISYLHKTHKEFKDYNILFRTKLSTCNLNNF